MIVSLARVARGAVVRRSSGPGEQLLEGRQGLERVRDRPAALGRDELGQLPRRALDALAERAAGRAVARTPVLGGGEDGGRGGDGPEVREQRAERVLERERVAGRPRRRTEQDRLARERLRLEHVEERLEQAAVGRGEDGR